MTVEEGLQEAVEADMWAWLREFVSVPNEFYDFEYAPCPYARGALRADTVDVVAWRDGDVRGFIREMSVDMRDRPRLTTRVMAFPPRTRFTWGLVEFVESLNAELMSTNVFLNTGSAKTTRSRYPGSDEPYFIVVANSLDAVLRGSEALQRSDYYENWPAEHYDIVVRRRARLAERYAEGTQAGG